jgi:hypothetical protein
MRRSGAVVALVALMPVLAAGDELSTSLGGHLKGRLLADAYPDNSVFRPIAGAAGLSGESELRLNLSASQGDWSVEADYQAFAINGDSVRIAGDLGLAGGPATIGVINDDRRLFDLTDDVVTSSDTLVVQRLDRFALTWTSDHAVVRLGRQALSWGGGLFFSPFDIVNPFDPAAVDTEYKTGDDMLYAQYLRNSGDDIQFAWVARRDPASGNVESDESTIAAKYHGIAGDREYDLLVADNRGRATLGAGGNIGLGGAVVRADLVVSDAVSWKTELVTNISYSWTWGGRNVSGAVEYYYNGWGLPDGDYSLADVAARPDLAERLARGETFTIGRHYLAGGLTIELTPLWLLMPNLFASLDDGSALAQAVLQHSLGDNLTFLGALNLPLGPDGSEFGGIPAAPGMPAYLSRDAGVFAQLAWYF